MSAIYTVNVRALKDRLSAWLRQVQQGDTVLVTDRGRAVAEIRKPDVHRAAVNALQGRRQRLLEEGRIRVGLPNTKDAYAPSMLSIDADVVDRALADSRGEAP